jgi:hydroxyacylglutathione hydrolase
MIIEKIKSEGLAHLSYLIGDGNEAAVIDPRRDCAVYVEMAASRGLRITHIFETHRNEDLISGAPALAELTGAPVHHGPNPAQPIRYAETVREGDCFGFGGLTLTVLETPGHTDDHVAYVIGDRDFDEGPVGVFTGDALFVGDVGRTDFYPDRAEEVAGALFDSLRKILALGDQAIIYPAHGAGSVCGAGMASREFSTVGHERLNNPRLRIGDRDAFIAAKVAENHYYPPYFRRMERLNAEGGPHLARPLRPAPVALDALDDTSARVVDVRSVPAFAGTHWSGSLCLPESMISSFAGWFLDAGEDLMLVAEDMDQAADAMTHLARIGFDRVVGAYSGMMPAAAGGKPLDSMSFVDAETVASRLQEDRNDWTLLDVRSVDELAEKRIDGAHHIYVGHLADQVGDLEPERNYTVMCASGARATVAAAWLRANGIPGVDVFLGSMGAWEAQGYPVS